MKKRFLAIALAACMMTGLAACSSGSGTGTSSGGAASTGTAAAETSVPADFMQKVFDALTADTSSYKQTTAMDTTTEYSETIDGNTITFKAEGQYVNGEWAFTLEDNYIVNTCAADDFMGSGFLTYVFQAAGEVLGMDRDLMLGYMRAAQFGAVETDMISTATEGDKITNKVYVGGAWDMSVLDGLALNDASMDVMEPLGDMQMNHFTGLGKVNVFALGNREECDITLAEHGGLTELGHKSLIAVAGKLQPAGYEDFVANYKEIGEAEGAGWKVTKISKAEAPEFFQELDEHEEFLLVHFGQ